MIKIYDSNTQIKQNLDEKNEISIYNCGPTVYNDVHIGNIRPPITFDVLVRFLRYKGDRVKYVMNLTDIDDKIIKKAKEENKNELEVSEFYSQAYIKLLKDLNILIPDIMPKVSENIEEIIDFTKALLDKNKGYVADDGDVYFDIDTVKDTYGEISKQDINELQNESRKELKNNKHNPIDFVLWKKTETGLNWPSPWNNHGRPGWHTECVTFINKYIGKQTTIHGGGVDLKFPHHENENAQNIALNGCGLAKVWMHVGHINVNNVKMSKSLNNFVLAKDMLKKATSNQLRWFFYQTTYENPINYTDELLNESSKNFDNLIKKINMFFINLELVDFVFTKNNMVDDHFIQCLDDDLNFPNAITFILQQVKYMSTLFKEKNYDVLVNSLNYIVNELAILGIKYEFNLNNNDKEIISKWKKALNEKDYSIVDQCRKYFSERNII